MSDIPITIVGTGYVGMSMAVLLAQHNKVTALDIDAQRVAQINAKQSTVVDAEIEAYLAERRLCGDCDPDRLRPGNQLLQYQLG